MIVEEPIIESILSAYASQIGEDLVKYKNHVYRVFYNCRLLDSDPLHHKVYAIAAAFHDIGIWTKHTIDYLDPSIEEAITYLRRQDEQQLTEQITAMIYWHHKIAAYSGPFAKTTETFRKADWADVSLGLIRFGMDGKLLRNARKALPNAGFHLFLTRKVVRNFFSHPLNPLPMFKR